MTNKTKWIAGAAIAAILAGGAGGVAVASGGGERGDGHPITGDAYDKATAKALETTGGGTVTETEAGDEESEYQVEVTLDDGSQVDVNLDEQFNVVDTKHENESEGADDSEAGDEGGPEGADDGADTGRDTNPNEPGHQDEAPGN